MRAAALALLGCAVCLRRCSRSASATNCARAIDIEPAMLEVAIKPLHKMSERQVRRELQAAGFKHLQMVRTLPLQHLIGFAADR